ncbi:helix-turn-helix transcriptional regulator [Skermania sp. ID1734]|uniref:TetR/AcrR family transcriptional regulator n=1 Tax=Skermania sp. ID1734 TaxID=2597516 RepID=UPI00117DB5A9|nr:helix-turn-helix domain-containing protein [Skermania sp. ID1734]TSE01981.1 helix-turn-helix transcriptional regulator [Skermania sp. ID1734]
MSEVKRRYDASRRREQARARRRATVLAAQELFERDGFQATTMTDIAKRAGVSAESIYKGFGSKAALAKAVFDMVIAGDDEPVPVAERPEVRSIFAEPDARRKIEIYVQGLAGRIQRSAKVQIVIRDGRHADPTLAAVWEKLIDEGLAGMTMFGRHLLETGQLRTGIELPTVRDALWNCIAVDHYERLVLQQRWTLGEYADWISRAMIGYLFD